MELAIIESGVKNDHDGARPEGICLNFGITALYSRPGRWCQAMSRNNPAIALGEVDFCSSHFD